MKLLPIILATVVSLNAFSQDLRDKFDFRLGVGVMNFPSERDGSSMLEYELNYQINTLLAASASLNLGREDGYSYHQWNLNLFVTPFKKKQWQTLRLGMGIASHKATRSIEIFTSFYSTNYIHNQTIYIPYKETVLGHNIILEKTFPIREKWLLGIKAFTQFYWNRDLNYGFLAKVGRRF